MEALITNHVEKMIRLIREDQIHAERPPREIDRFGK